MMVRYYPITVETILKVPFFNKVSDKTLKLVINHCKIKHFPAYYDIFKKDDQDLDFYIIIEGEVGVYKTSFSHHLITTLSQNDIFGEMALITQMGRNANVKTITDCSVIVIPAEILSEIMILEPSLGEQINDIFLKRLKENDK